MQAATRNPLKQSLNMSKIFSHQHLQTEFSSLHCSDHLKLSCSRVIWLGDLNYRIALSYRSAKALVEMQNWRALLEKDQV